MFNFKNHLFCFRPAKNKKQSAWRRIPIIACCFFYFFFSAFIKVGEPEIKIILNGIHPEKGGKLLISIFRSADGFPEDGSKAFKVSEISPRKEIQIQGIPPGYYAIAVLHDLDGNRKMSYSILGVPEDGFASSPDGGPRFSKPKFEKAIFKHSKAGSLLELKLKYMP
jgi:uncharacterized protein (DUF2141 family)